VSPLLTTHNLVKELISLVSAHLDPFDMPESQSTKQQADPEDPGLSVSGTLRMQMQPLPKLSESYRRPVPTLCRYVYALAQNSADSVSLEGGIPSLFRPS